MPTLTTRPSEVALSKTTVILTNTGPLMRGARNRIGNDTPLILNS
ncbi:uncharacterized protein METZ01_LOCUS39910 [marine metagenome]|uniref:Uncharacterized protein n=1 Tax=marine metagenome TaxID=408172 RepID=A0A381R5M6_9ZZZZ